MQNRVDALFKQIACDSEYFDRGAAVLEQNTLFLLPIKIPKSHRIAQ